MKRMLCLFLSLVMVLGMLSGCGGKTEEPKETQMEIQQETQQETLAEVETTDVEILKAIDLGLVPESLQGDYDAQISYAEFCSILDSFVSVMFPEKMDDWKQTSAKYHDAGDLMSRMEGALVLLYAAECCGIDAVGCNASIPLEDFVADDLDFFEGVTWDYPLLPDPHELYYNETLANSIDFAWRCEHMYLNNAIWFVEYLSYGNGKAYFDYDERFLLNLGDPFIRGDAIRAVERLYENARFAKFVPVDSVNCTISTEAIATGAAMPEVSWQKLPEWRGHTVPPGNWNITYGGGMLYQKEFIEALGELGFDFVRVPLDSRVIFNGNDMTAVNPAYLETMDDLVEYCAAEGIHVCFDLHDMPGFYTGGDASRITLWKDAETQNLFVQFWRFMAEYYKDVPTNLLSFNLLNEPHGVDDEPADALYSEIMFRAIEAIREVTSERLIFVDALNVTMGIPVQGLANAQIVQAVHPYFLKNGAQNWPSYVIHGFINRGSGALTLNGNFPTGTKITANIIGVHGQSEVVLSADGNALATLELGTEAIRENGCNAIYEEGTDGEWRGYDGVPLAAELTEDSHQITLVQKNGGWYRLESLTVETDSYTVSVTSDNDMVSDSSTPILTISESGVVSAERESTLIIQDREELEEQFQTYQKFTEETGTLIMVQEFGFNETIDYQATLAAADDFLSVLDAYDIPWCSWSGNFGALVDYREYQWSELATWHKFGLREGAEYEMVSENYMIDTGLMEVYQKYMNK